MTSGLFEFRFDSPIISIPPDASSTSPDVASIFGAPVPEPPTWVMMILGVAMIGFAARRRMQEARAA